MECCESIRSVNRWETQRIDTKCKNKHRHSHNKISRKSSNSLSQLLRNGKGNLQLLDRIYTNQSNKHYSLHHYLQLQDVYDDYAMILRDTPSNLEDDDIDTNMEMIHSVQSSVSPQAQAWQCDRCTFINTIEYQSCQMCSSSIAIPHVLDTLSDCDVSSSSFSSISAEYSVPLSTTSSYCSLAQCIISKRSKPRRKYRKRRDQQNIKSSSSCSSLHDRSFKQFKRFMAKRNTSIIAFKPQQNEDNIFQHKLNKEKQKTQQLYDMYGDLYLARKRNTQDIHDIVTKMAHYIPKRHLTKEIHHHIHDNNDDTTCVVHTNTNTNTCCQVCFVDCSEDDSVHMVAMKDYCSHCMICSECFRQHLEITIRDDEHILPWLLCPAPECKAPIHVSLLLQYLSAQHLYTFATSFLYKHLQRSSSWMECPDAFDTKCKYGWIDIDIENDNSDSIILVLECDACGCTHSINKEEAAKKGKNSGMDDGFAQLIAQGIMRECPKCSYPAMKDYGMCNVMHCPKCNVYWNWRTKETGSSSNEVKQRARMSGTLWEAGELSYQLDLQRNNLPAFIELLARNGIKYDPNYRRGS